MAEIQPEDGGTGNKATNASVTTNEQDSVICNAAVDDYFLGVKDELKQIDRLVSDAVNNLVINFRYISKLTQSHHEMVLAIEKMAAPEGSKPILELLDKQMTIATKIEQELEAAITSLQFGDLVTQLLAHTARQVEVLNMELQRVDRQRAVQMGDSGKRTDETLNDGISKAVQMANAKGKSKPVVQQGMEMGDIELF